MAVFDVNAAPFASKTDALAFATRVQGQCTARKEYREKLERCIKAGEDSQNCFDRLTAPSTGTAAIDEIKAAIVQHARGGPRSNRALEDVTRLVGNAAAAVPALGGAVDSFLPGVRPAVLQSLGELQDPQTLGASAALPRVGSFVFRIGGFANPTPKLNPLIEDAASSRDQVESLDQDFNPEDDYYVTGDLSLVGPWFGREGVDHVEAQSRLSRSLMAGFDIANDQDDPIQLFDDVSTWITIGAGSTKIDPKEANALACAAEMVNRMSAESKARVKRGYLGDFWRFVHNQPQFTVAARRLHRDDLVGADSHSVRATLSSGLLNNVSFLKLMPQCTAALGGERCAAFYQRVAQWPTMTHGVGVSAYYERGNIADVSVTLPAIAGLVPQPPLPVTIEGGDFRRYGWSLGFSLSEPADADYDADSAATPVSIRLDGGTEYFKYETGSARFDHKVSKVTLTYRRGPVSIPLHVMYRAKSEFEAQVSDDIVVGIGSQFEIW